jgi:hypothetical protein
MLQGNDLGSDFKIKCSKAGSLINDAFTYGGYMAGVVCSNSITENTDTSVPDNAEKDGS